MLLFNGAGVPPTIPPSGLIFFAPTGGKLRDVRIEAPTGASPISSFSGPLTISNVEVATGASVTPGFNALNLSIPGTTIDRLVTTGPAPVMLTSFFPGPPASQPVVMRRSSISSSGGLGLQTGSNTVVSDTVVRATGTGIVPPTAVVASGGKLRNVTAIASGTGATGLRAAGSIPPTIVSGPVSAKNSIFWAEGGVADVTVDPAIAPNPTICVPFPPCIVTPGGDLTITNSNFRTNTGTLNAASGSNQAGRPAVRGSGSRRLPAEARVARDRCGRGRRR